jgi:crotonobetaine/carnitine-CoA ligase
MKFSRLVESLPASGGVTFGARRYATPELVSLARRAAVDLHRRGVRPGDRVASMVDNGIAALVGWFGAALAGACYVPINTRLRGGTLTYILEDSAPRVVIADPPYVSVVGAHAGARAPSLTDSGDWLADVCASTETSGTDAVGGCMIYTSGTTGRPKGVQWASETQALHATSYARELVPLASGEQSYSCLPLFHVTCMGVTMANLIQGATVHVDQRFSASGFWRRLGETQAVFFPYVGTILSLLLKDEAAPPPHRVRFAMGAAAPLDVFKRFEQRFGVRLLETWGQTETASIWLANHDHVPGSIGTSCPRADFRIAPIDGDPCSGELQVRPRAPASMMSGYHGDPAATAGAWENGWYSTRDRVRVDADGNYFFVGRLADCLRRRGENVSAYEVEQAVLKHPDLLEAAVVGVDSELGEQDIALYYVEREAGRVESRALEAWCRTQLGDFMVPRYYCAVGEFPKTETQRVQKGILHDQVKLQGAYDAERKEMIR